MKELLEKKLNLIIAGVVIIALIAIGIPLSVNTVQTHTSDAEIETTVATTQAPSTTEPVPTNPPTELKIISKTVKLDTGEKEKAEKKTAKKQNSKKKTSKKKQTN
ncbi:MAG: hypothetical protein IJ903_05710 [Ruminococcus sp.]|nr:hypothetical protein [Ruminococcus sp.]